MLAKSWIQSFFSALFAFPREKSKTKPYYGPLQFLTLEDRINPSTFMVTNTDYSGPGSLGEAITLANASAGNDEISFSLTGPSPFTITLESALPVIVNANAPITSGTGGTVGTLTIIGLGSSSLTITGDNGNSNRNFNVFNIDSGGVLTISGVTVSGGKIAGPGRGGAFNNFGTLNISNSTLSGNSAVNNDNANGGAISNTGTLTVSNSTLSGNSAGINGGGIVNYGTLTISNSTISGNSATGQGGGIFNKNGAVTVLNSTISGNSTTDIRNGGGGGIFNEGGAFTVSNSTLSGNSAMGYGGGIFNEGGAFTVSNSTLSGNSARSSGGGVYNNYGTITFTNSTLSGNSAGNYYGGGVYNNYGTVTVTNSTLSGNSAGSDGGGIFNKNGAVTVTNSTLSGNSAAQVGGAIYNNSSTVTLSNSTLTGNTANSGGGFYNRGTLTVTNSTLSGNSAKYFGGAIQNRFSTVTVSNSTFSGNYAGRSGGGIDNGNDGTLTVSNSTLSGNAATSGGGIFNGGTVNIANTIIANSASGGDFFGGSNVNLIAPASAANNLVTQNTFAWATTVTPAAINLGPLQFNGGPTFTMALLTGSPAIGAGEATISNAAPVNGIDQRGFSRSSTTPSIGAFEFYNAPTVTSVSPASGTTAGSTPITISGANFVAGPTNVTIGGVAATNVAVVNSTTITTNTPSGTGGNASVLVTTAGGTNANNTLFTYYVPAPLVTGTTGESAQGSTLSFVDRSTGQTNTVVPFPGFMGEVRVASGDINGDGKMETLAAAGTGGGPAVNILDSTGNSITAFFAYDPAFTGGLYISVSDLNNDGFADIITGAGAGGGPHVKIFNGKNLQEMGSFFAYAESFAGGVSVASADINNDGTLDVVTGAGPGGGPHVKVFDGKTKSLISQWFAYSPDFTGGVYVAMGDIGNNGQFEVVTGPGQGGGPVVAVFTPTGVLQTQFLAYADAFLGGVRVGVSDGNGDGVLDLITGAGPGGGPHLKGFNYPQLDLLFESFSGPEDNTEGVFVS